MLKTALKNLLTKKRLSILILIIVIPMIILEIWSANRLATYGKQISDLEKTKASLSLDNEVLENQIADKSSLLEIGQRSQNIGFIKNGKVVYLEPQNQ